MRRYQILWFCFTVALGGDNTSTKLSEGRAELLVKHLDLMRELKTTIADKYGQKSVQQKKSKLDAPTDAHNKFSYLRSLIDSNWSTFFEKNKKFVESIIARERENIDNYYVFYHAQRNGLRVFQDFLREIYEYFQITQSLRSFHFLRFWKDMPETTDANTFIDENNKKGYWNDSGGGMYKFLLSVNLSLFGSCTAVSCCECTFDFFVNSKNIISVNSKDILNEIFDMFKFDKKYIDSLASLENLIQTKEGNLYQFFIPKKVVDHCAYLSHAFGIPYNSAVPGCGFDQTKCRHANISKVLDAYRQGSALVDAYKKDSAHTNESESSVALLVDQMQGRLIFSRDMLLNPASGIKIYRYTTASDQVVACYTKQLKNITHQIFVDWLQSSHAGKGIEGSKLLSLYQNL